MTMIDIESIYRHHFELSRRLVQAENLASDIIDVVEVPKRPQRRMFPKTLGRGLTVLSCDRHHKKHGRRSTRVFVLLIPMKEISPLYLQEPHGVVRLLRHSDLALI